ncbi:DUF3344 domain-containing protein [Streptomyces sp. Act143]|uniref:DUF3344 domain-containing protein n=1 Tax=Streptomyces sp. Act143 TaxID=2200760 RepID=UPI000D67EFDA|nr:DUF3344 domain-containing protein [Streptomyces sp. Act143]PWI18316.1 DUF3344 domain-containing protein [Streptomyces sp. Act143]
MRQSPRPLLRRATVGVLALAAAWAPVGALAAAPPSPEAERLPFTERYRALQHGGIVRAANTSISCRTTTAAPSCPAVREGGTAANGDFDMFYVDVDTDPNTYNSSRAEVRLPEGARATYARLYWGGNLRVGEQKPPKDNGRVLIAEPGGQYKEVLADTLVGHRVAQGADAFQASADVTKLVRESGSGLYTVAQVNVAMGKSAAGAWGGWTLVVAYEKAAEPLRHLALWDGFDTLKPGRAVTPAGLGFPKGASGVAGLVAYDGDRGRTGDSLTLTAGSGAPVTLTDAANPRTDVLNSTISEPGERQATRVPSYANTLGYDSDVFDLGTALGRGGDQLAFRLVSQRDAAWAGALFVAVDAQK